MPYPKDGKVRTMYSAPIVCRGVFYAYVPLSSEGVGVVDS